MTQFSSSMWANTQRGVAMLILKSVAY